MILRIRKTSRCDGKKRIRGERFSKNRFYYILGRNNFPRKNPWRKERSSNRSPEIPGSNYSTPFRWTLVGIAHIASARIRYRSHFTLTSSSAAGPLFPFPLHCSFHCTPRIRERADCTTLPLPLLPTLQLWNEANEVEGREYSRKCREKGNDEGSRVGGRPLCSPW